MKSESAWCRLLSICSFCGRVEDPYLLHECKYCGLLVCSKCILPEKHGCKRLPPRSGLTYYSKMNEESLDALQRVLEKREQVVIHYSYCTDCGERLYQKQEIAEVSGGFEKKSYNHCKKCGKRYPQDYSPSDSYTQQQFCPNCGHKISQDDTDCQNCSCKLR